MALRATSDNWGWLARLLHWGMLVLFLGIIPAGFYMSDLPTGPQKFKIYALHKSIGITLLTLAGLRLLWRLGQRRPQLPPMPAWQERVAGATHVLLYVLMFAIPLAGWLYNSAAGFPLRWFGLFNLPALTGTNPALKVVAREAHEAGALLLIALVGLHAAGAFKHHFVDHDQTLRLMLPKRRKSP